MRAVKMALATRVAPWSIAEKLDNGTIRRLVILIVDARATPNLSRDRKARAPGLTSSILTSASAPLSNYSTETIELVRDLVGDLSRESERYRADRMACAELSESICADSKEKDCLEKALARCHESFGLDEANPPADPEIYFIHARLDLIEDEALRSRLKTLPTSLQLPAQDVEALIEVAPEILSAAPDFRRLTVDLGAEGNN